MALDIAPESSQTKVLLGSALSAIGEIDQAIEWLEDAIEQQPTHHVALTICSAAYLQVGKPLEALRMARAAVQLEPHNVQAHKLVEMATTFVEIEGV